MFFHWGLGVGLETSVSTNMALVVRLIGSFCVFRPPLSSLWGAMGLLLALLGAAFGPPWGALGRPWALFGALWAASGSLVAPFWKSLKIGRHFPSKSGSSTMPAHNFGSRNSAPDPVAPAKVPGILRRIPTIPRKWSRPGRSGPGFTRAGGQDDGSLHKLPQINIVFNIA